ncbi:MAG: hypothetical protein ABT02_07675 [Comamonadaceae bacterium SCN 68-20]|nr:MAG: hypothetical protein ABT02_07675 [Comamonadaceae bacterium SCN 68-20]OJX37216.1 MAG: hypothetical protein BGO75_14915 [Burkholderiales bacterium 68-20]
MDKPPPNDSSDLIADRRRKLVKGKAAIAAQLPTDGSDVWGLALSGGGIRSATFSLGLLRGLAQQKLLNRFDVLSTVSGGGYVGSALGRLYVREQQSQAAQSQPSSAAPAPPVADRVEAAMAHVERTWFGWWLRSNGRYLAPAGFTDRLFAITICLRNLLALHFEFGLLAVLAGCLLAAVDLGVWQGIAANGYPLGTVTPLLKPWLPTAWLLLPVVLLFALHWVFAYWDTQWVAKRFGRYVAWKAALCVALLAAALTICGLAAPSAGQGTVTLFRLLPGVAFVAVLLLATSALDAWCTWRGLVRQARDAPVDDVLAEMRNQLTSRLMWCLGIGALILALGVAERLAWLLAFESRIFQTLDLGIVLAVLAGAAQAVVTSLGKRKTQEQQRAEQSSPLALYLLQGVGYLFTAALFVCWVSLVLKISFGPVFPDLGKPGGVPQPLHFGAGWLALLCVFVPPALYVVATGSNLGFLNLSSLHTFYKARLVRTWFGATNPERFRDRGVASALETIHANELTTSKVENVGKVAAGDDILLKDYAPHLAGGPVHIINTCVNQTADPKGRLFNRDRKGLLLSVRSGGASRLSQEGWRDEFKGIGKLSVGGWAAISGAAAAPGLGYRTQRGLAALLTFAGVRLGYWLSQYERAGERPSIYTLLARAKEKPRALLREMSATFSAGATDDWFLSDGGHFENTAVYALLLERASVIVLADCGADPGYSFEDVENLVRKARIDLGVTITFRQPRDLSSVPPTVPFSLFNAWRKSRRYFGSLQELARDGGSACLALATVDYPDASSQAPGILVLVKPNTCTSVALDVANYKRQHPRFPQESTGDQFFSENQWESYFSLGTDLGKHLSHDLLAPLRTHLDAVFDLGGSGPASLLPATPSAATDEQPAAAPASRSIWGPQAGAVGATLGAGAVISVAIAAWQSFDAYRTDQAERTAGERAAVANISDLWGGLSSTAASSDPSGAANKLAAALLRAGDAYCVKGEAGWPMKSELGRHIVGEAVRACEALKSGMGSACQALAEARHGLGSMPAESCFRETPAPSRVVYWGYDYSAKERSQGTPGE